MSKKGNPVDIAKKADSKTLKRLLSYISQYRIQFIFVLVSILLSAVASVVSTLFLKTLIDDYITPLLLEAIPDFSGLARLILIMAGIYLIGVIATLFYNRVMVVIAQGVLKEIRDEMFEKMQKLPIRYFDTHSHGDIMSHYTNDTDTLRQMLTQSIPQLFSSVVTIVAVFVSMLTLSLWLTIFVVLFTFIILKVVGNIASKSSKYFVSQQKSLGNVNGYIEEMINGQKVVKVFCHEDKAKELFNQKNEELCKNATEANRFANMLGPLMNNMGYILYVSMAIVGGGLAILGVTNVSLSGVGTLTLGMIASFLQLSRSFIMPLSQVSQQLSSIVMAIAGAGRIFNLIDEKHEEDRGYVTLVNVNKINGEIIETKEHSHHWAWKHPHSDGTITYTELKGEVRFFDVDFGYNEEKIVLHNISLYAEPGQKIAFVGATGAGKTTITNLINRFYDIADGKIRYDGININKIKKNDLRRSLGIVLQDVNLFTGTVMENIRYGRLDASDEECIQAAKLANADGFIRMLPNGYNTIISGDGSDLSQGQRQLISIARAAVADPPVMILDEATSSIDTHTESIVQSGMDSLMEGRTVFVIAHRLSTVKNSDVIMVLEKGRIIERGSHESLIKEKGKYYQLYTGAFELE
ncbi:ABC transporter ATP-binding protein [Clostridium paraputrificum]|uniref:ABC transporter ATP-binding protein n=1 Tax=Clostridium TaxID=1485 RepID=UPI001898A64C|nr:MULTISPECIES: ABC transporter ATP-binding protein [Clostridium]MDB2089724.1 ABC transporter ATP-binding protein [Clostridium paraputrificum]MDB2096101.1 ABC transporter ATP-binding protein [Clostridium paraputrificum]MDB2104458.1 ABC transporter ATP-binding protein [Clostridium paraputrificum]MDB2125392.1 ABC transporter ATP-binding protein [Clostridium paraputrificum]MDC0801649.1 ABC transporter ATP-binding protein [Clostridium paraputrificum]